MGFEVNKCYFMLFHDFIMDMTDLNNKLFFSLNNIRFVSCKLYSCVIFPSVGLYWEPCCCSSVRG